MCLALFVRGASVVEPTLHAKFCLSCGWRHGYDESFPGDRRRCCSAGEDDDAADDDSKLSQAELDKIAVSLSLVETTMCNNCFQPPTCDCRTAVAFLLLETHVQAQLLYFLC